MESKNSRKTQLTNLSVTGTVGASFALPAIGEAISAAGAAIAGLVSWPVVAVGVAVIVVAGGISYLVYKSNSKDDDKGESKGKGASGAGKNVGANDVDIDNIPEGWTRTDNNGRTHVKDENGKTRVRIDPPDSKTPYKHRHNYDEKGNTLNKNGDIVDRKSPDGHIPIE